MSWLGLRPQFHFPTQKKGSKIKKVASVEEGDETLDSPGSQSRGSVPCPVHVCMRASPAQSQGAVPKC